MQYTTHKNNFADAFLKYPVMEPGTEDFRFIRFSLIIYTMFF